MTDPQGSGDLISKLKDELPFATTKLSLYNNNCSRTWGH